VDAVFHVDNITILSIYLLMDLHAVFSFLSLQMGLLKIYLNNFFMEYALLFLIGKYF
jgi:hypothetical protein